MKRSTVFALLSVAFLPQGLCAEVPSRLHSGGVSVAERELQQKNKQKQSGFVSDGTLHINGNEYFYFSLPPFDAANIAATTQIYEVPSLPAGVDGVCYFYCNAFVTNVNVRVKSGSAFTSITDGNGVTISSGESCSATLLFNDTVAGPLYLMAYSDGAMADGYLECYSNDIPRTSYYYEYVNTPYDYGYGNTDLVAYDPSKVADTTAMIEMLPYYYYSLFPPSTQITCEIACDVGGSGVAEMKFGERFSSLGQGTASNAGADASCPFTITATSPATEGEAWLLIYSNAGYLFNLDVECTSPDLTNYPTWSPYYTDFPTFSPPTPTTPSPIPPSPTPSPIAPSPTPPPNKSPSPTLEVPDSVVINFLSNCFNCFNVAFRWLGFAN